MIKIQINIKNNHNKMIISWTKKGLMNFQRMTISLYGSNRNDVLIKMSQKSWLCTKNFVHQKQACRSSSVCVLAGVLTDLCFRKQRLYSCGTATESHRSFPVSFSGWPLRNHCLKPSSDLAKWESFSNPCYSAFLPSQVLHRYSQGISDALRRKTLPWFAAVAGSNIVPTSYPRPPVQSIDWTWNAAALMIGVQRAITLNELPSKGNI